MFAFVKRLFWNRWVAIFLGLLLFSLLIWFVGPLFAFAGYPPLGPVKHRIVVIVLAVLLVVIPPLFRWIRDGVATKKLIQAIKDQAKPDPDLLKANPDIIHLTDEFDHAVKALRKGPGRKSLYSMPWYIVIGPPATGKTTLIDTLDKTTAIGQARQSLPTSANTQHQQAVHGIGGTRNCKWWFTRDAVLIDTAGRYFAQDSNQAQDQAEWWQFLRLLKQRRRRRPINGALVTLSLEELARATREQRARHAETIKNRLIELHQQLDIRVPIYFLLTKADTLQGFNEFFGEFHPDEREQVWGFNLPEASSEDLSSTLTQEFSKLLDRLNEQMVTRVQREHNPDKRKRMIGFPKQLGLHQGAVISLLKVLFADQQVVNATQLRGVYLTSGTQDGSVLDSLVSSGHAFAQTNHDPYWAKPASDISYFVHSVFTKVIFPESGLVGNNPRLERWLTRGRRFAYGVTFALGVGGCGAMGYNYWQNQALLAQTHQTVEALESTLKSVHENYLSINAIPLSVRTDLLSQLEQLPNGDTVNYGRGTWESDFGATLWATLRHTGLSQYPALKQRAQSIYDQLASLLLLPAITDYLSTILRTSEEDERRYTALKHYVMLTQSQHYNSKAMAEGLQKLGWSFELESESGLDVDAFDRHLTHLLHRFDPNRADVRLNEPLVEHTRNALLQKVPEDKAVYASVKADLHELDDVQAIPAFSLYEAAGGIGTERLLQRKTGAELRHGIDPLFTQAGFKTFDQRADDLIETQYQERQWVFGLHPARSVDSQTLKQSVTDLYYDEYIQHYTALLNDIELAPFITANQAYRALETLTNPDSPRLVKLIQHLCEQTKLDNRLAQLVKQLPGQPVSACDTSQYRLTGQSDRVTQTFRPLHQLMQGKDANTWSINNAIDLLNKLRGFLQTVAVEFAASGTLPQHLEVMEKGIVQELRAEAKSYPQPIENILLSAATQTSNITQLGIVEIINRAWKAEPLLVCKTSIAGRYPFATADGYVNFQDFVDFFGYGGVLENFFTDYLVEYVDVSTRPWQNKSSASDKPLLSPESLRFFQKAHDIKRSFFSRSTEKPSIRFTITPGTLHENARRATLSLDGQRLAYQHDQQRPTSLKWPGPSTQKIARLDIELFDGKTVSLVEEGDWAWFKLLEHGRLRRNGGHESYQLSFNVEGYSMAYTLTANSAFNPFQQNLRTLACIEGM